MRRILVLRSNHRADVDGRLVGKHKFATDDLNARAKRRAAAKARAGSVLSSGRL